MGIQTLPAEDADMQRLFTITSIAFKDNEPFWDAMYPHHTTEAGRKIGGERFIKAKKADPNTHYIKAVDDSTGEITGFAKWNVFQDRLPTSAKAEGPYWESEEDREYAQHLMNEFAKDRAEFVKSHDGNAVNLDILVIDPQYQRMGIGGKLVAWGVERADELGFDAVIESSVFGRGLYAKNGFVWKKNVELELPEKWKGRAPSRYAWMVKEKKA